MLFVNGIVSGAGGGGASCTFCATVGAAFAFVATFSATFAAGACDAGSVGAGGVGVAVVAGGLAVAYGLAAGSLVGGGAGGVGLTVVSGGHLYILHVELGVLQVVVVLGLHEEYHCLCDEEGDDDCGEPVGALLQAGEPCAAVPAAALEHRPEAVGHVEPQGYESNDVCHKNPPLREGFLEEEGAGGR